MGTHDNINHNTFPKQSDFPAVGAKVRVCFDYDTAHVVGGVVVRSDAEEPFVTIFKLEDDRHVLATECQWQPDKRH